jgi:hypothetical protein
MRLPLHYHQLKFLRSRASTDPNSGGTRSVKNSGFVIVSKFLSYMVESHVLTMDFCPVVSLRLSSLRSSQPLCSGISFYGSSDREASSPSTFQRNISNRNGTPGNLNPHMATFQADPPPDRPPT